jgi:hypothetical protein
VLLTLQCHGTVLNREDSLHDSLFAFWGQIASSVCVVFVVRREYAVGPVLCKWLHNALVTILIYCCGAFQIKKQASNIVVGVESFITKQTLKPALEEIREKKEEEIKRRIEKEEEARKKREQKVKEEVEEKRR